ncbi:MAG: hypothetical protein MZW92_14470 [Comamonadaceae bacterium]|nr:hypothetical protein [Comamonadaceae bacterium]
MLRRIERRMQVLHCPSLAGYRERLAASPDELVLLRRELLIPVTRFFRDPEVFELLAEQVVPELVQRAGPEGLRAWVACCATGEEAYSMAMLFAEGFERAGKPCSVKIFATDVERQYLDHAAAGLYPETIAAELSPERLGALLRRAQRPLAGQARAAADGHLRAPQRRRRPAVHADGRWPAAATR